MHRPTIEKEPFTVRGPVESFIKFIQPFVNKRLRQLTEPYRIVQQEKGCAHCGRKKPIVGAHWPRGLNQIIWETLWGNFRSPAGGLVVEGDVDLMIKAILKEHEPIEEAYRFVCEDCHKAHYATQKVLFPTPEMYREAGLEIVQAVAMPLRPNASGTLGLAPRQLELMEPLWEAFPDSVQGSQLAIRLGNPGNTRLVSSMVKEIKQRGYPIQQDGRGRYWCEPPAG